MATATAFETVGELLELLSNAPKDAKLKILVSDGVNKAAADVLGGWNESKGDGPRLVDNSNGVGGYITIETVLDQKWGRTTLNQ
jgi:hypothetical protein